jgi:hypothetical protein
VQVWSKTSPPAKKLAAQKLHTIGSTLTFCVQNHGFDTPRLRLG